MSRFSDYLQKTFSFTSQEAEQVIEAMIQPIGKSIRINTRKIALEDFKIHAQEQGWTLTETDIPEVFLIDRDDTTVALGNTPEHMAGWFYIQEVAAAHPPHLLREQILQIAKNIRRGVQQEGNHDSGSEQSTINDERTTILDMCAAPGGKTTQLADYFPDALVIANEVNRTRTPQLFDNLDRMGYDNIAVVSCDGRFFQNFPEFFDAVLLDAPCSGEGTAFRDSSIVDHWHEKNIDRIAKLQKQLFETAEAVVKPGGCVSYSTCTLNVMENEEVLDSRLKTEKPHLTELFRKRFWPHIEHTGGFFASIFQKVTPFVKGDENEEIKIGDFESENPQSLRRGGSTAPSQRSSPYPILAAQGQKNLIVKPATKGEWEIVERFITKHLKSKLKNGFLYLTKDGVYFNQRNLGPLAEYFYFVHAGMKIGTIKNNTFTPTNHIFGCVESPELPTLHLTHDLWKEILLRKHAHIDLPDGYYIVRYGRGVIGLGEVQKGEYLGI